MVLLGAVVVGETNCPNVAAKRGGWRGGGGGWGEYDVGAMTRGGFAWCMINFSKIISLVLYINCIKALTCEIFLSGALGWG